MITSFVQYAQKPADNGPHSRFFEKVNPFHNLFTIYSHFQFFPYFPENLRLRPGTLNTPYALIALASVGRPADDRERPCFRPVPAYANFLLLLAVGYMRPIFPETRLSDRCPIWQIYLLKVIGILSRDFLDLYPEVKHLSREGCK